jgi:hypothetical protein
MNRPKETYPTNNDVNFTLCNKTSALPFQVWCQCGHISGQHAAAFPHRCACDGNRWIDGRGSVCNCLAFEALKEPAPHERAMSAARDQE